MRVLMYQERFVTSIRSKRKRQTIRGFSKRPTLPGEELSHRRWTAKPYRGPQEIILASQCDYVELVQIGRRKNGSLAVELSGRLLGPVAVERFAKADGFEDAADMLSYYVSDRSLPFAGVVIRW